MMTETNQTEKDAINALISLLQLDEEDEEESIFMIILRDTMSEDGADIIALFSYKDLRNTGARIPFYLVVEVKLLQFCLKYLQEQGLCSIYRSFDCSSINYSVFRKFIN